MRISELIRLLTDVQTQAKRYAVLHRMLESTGSKLSMEYDPHDGRGCFSEYGGVWKLTVENASGFHGHVHTGPSLDAILDVIWDYEARANNWEI